MALEIFAIHEVYYDDSGEPYLVTEDPCYPQGETLEELEKDFVLYQKALEEPVLNYEDFAGGDMGASGNPVPKVEPTSMSRIIPIERRRGFLKNIDTSVAREGDRI